jgi:Peptidase family M23
VVGCSDAPGASLGTGVAVARPPMLEPARMFAPPVAQASAISSTFGPRWKLSAQRTDFHPGIDYYGAIGDPLFAIGDGVATIYRDGSTTFPDGGNVIVIEHAIPPRLFHDQLVARMFAVYLHADSIAVADGEVVTTGQVVGTMGKTGDTDFVHLHFETRVGTPCSLIYQTAHPDSGCTTGFDPHVHPYLFVGGADANAIAVDELDETEALVVRYTATRGDLDLDVIETDLGTIGFDTRTGIDATSFETLDRFDFSFVEIVPEIFGSTSEALRYELRFPLLPGYLELRDIDGNGIRFERPSQTM